MNKTEDEKQQKKENSTTFSLTIENTVIVAITLSILSILFSVFFSIFYEPNWVKETINTNSRLCSKINNEKLVLIGSGTVHEYIKESHILNKYFEIVDSTCLISVEVPSLTACKTLKDEARNNNEWLVMSSIKAEPNDFMDKNEVDNFKKEKRIVEVFLKKDKLIVITTKDFPFNKFFSTKGKTSTAELRNLLSKSDSLNFDIYTTSEESGTLHLYKSKIGESILKGTKKFGLTTVYPEDKPYIILASNLYKPKNFDYENHNTYEVFDTDNKAIEKELFLYFSVDYRSNETKLKVSKEIMKFLNCVRNDFVVPEPKNDLIIRDNTSKTE